MSLRGNAFTPAAAAASVRTELVSTEPGAPPRLALRQGRLPAPGPEEVRVRVTATSVNPIDAKRASGYGRRLLALKGAARFPLMLGNDFAGIVDALGAGVSGFAVGQAVYGLTGTDKGGGAHASHVVVRQSQLLAAPPGAAPAALAVLPYTFTTMWLAVHGAGLRPANARRRQVLVLGAAGGQGQLALPLLASWGCDVTAVCSAADGQGCLALGARRVVERGAARIAALAPEFDAVLNFASWDDDALLASRLAAGALGHATTVHPLLGNFDRRGWVGGALTTLRDHARGRAAVRARAARARYAWTVFKPERAALEALAEGVAKDLYALPVGIEVAFARAAEAFSHVDQGGKGRALLIPLG